MPDDDVSDAVRACSDLIDVVHTLVDKPYLFSLLAEDVFQCLKLLDHSLHFEKVLSREV